jgi:hypothetical protein
MTMKSSGRFCRPYDLRQREQLLRLGPRLHAAHRQLRFLARIRTVPSLSGGNAVLHGICTHGVLKLPLVEGGHPVNLPA